MKMIDTREWHPGAQLGIAALFVAATIFILISVGRVLPAAWHGNALSIGLSAIAALAFVGMYVLFCRVIEGRPARDLSLGGAAVELAAGIGIGLMLFSAIVAVIWALGGYTVVGRNDPGVLPPVVAMVLVSAFPEEIVFRGLIFRLVEKWLGSWIALGVSAALFGAAHLSNPGATWLAAVAIALEAGVMLSAIYMITRRLWAAIGVHAAWNFAQGGVYGISVSGERTRGLLAPGPTHASDLITGGAFGAEASLPAMVVATAFGLMLLVIAWRRGRFVAPPWRRPQSAGAQE